MNTFEKRDRTSFTPQKPHRAPWAVICALAASLSFAAGYMLQSDGYGAPDGRVADALTEKVSSRTFINNTTRRAGVMPLVTEGQNPVAEIVSSVEPVVVSIDTVIHERPSSSRVNLNDLLFPKSKKRAMSESDNYEAHGAGSGIIVRSDGYILTNSHVLKGADDIKVTLNDGRKFKGRVVGHDNYTDVAMLKIEAADLPVARLGESKEVRPGDWAIAIGSPLGLNHTVTMGIVSAVGRSLADLNNNVDLIQTDAAINPGNSGGPLLNIKGEVVGINMAIRTDAQNIGFSIPIDIAREAASSIVKHRPLVRPYLGLSMADFDPQLADSVGVPNTETGVLVSKVADEGPAAVSGIAEGDLIETVQSLRVFKGSDVQKAVRDLQVGDKLELGIFRDGKHKSVKVTLKAYPPLSIDSEQS